MKSYLPHEAVFRARGFSLCHRTDQLSRFGEPLKRISRVLKDTPFFEKVLTNPIAGKIRVSLAPIGVGSDANMRELLTQVEETLTAPRPQPEYFLGERSPVYALRRELTLGSRILSPRKVDGLQAKGFLYKPPHKIDFGFPEMRVYRGLGANPANPVFNSEGDIAVFPMDSRVCGSMTFDEVIFEALYPALLAQKSRFATPSFGFGEFLDLNFIPSATVGRRKVGFALHFVEGQSYRLRTPRFIQKVIEEVRDPIQQKLLISKAYEMIGRMLSGQHELGVALGHPHIDNYSFPYQPGVSPKEVTEGARVHDFDSILWRGDTPYQAFFGFALFDLSETVMLNSKAADFNLNRGQIESAAQSAAQSRGISLEEARAIFSTMASTASVLLHPSVTEPNPLVTFFRSYFLEQARDLAAQPMAFVDSVAEDVSFHLEQFLHIISRGNPHRAIYQPDPASFFAHQAGYFTPLLLNKKLQNCSPDKLLK